MSPVKNGDKRYIRKEYIETNNLDETYVKNPVKEENQGEQRN